MEISELRSKIDRVDEQIIELLNERFQHSEAIAKEKARVGDSVHNPLREEEVMQHVKESADRHFLEEVEALYKEILYLSKSVQYRQMDNMRE